MERTDPFQDAITLGLCSAVAIDEEELRSLASLVNEIIKFAEEHNAVFNEGAGQMILLEVKGKQRLFPEIGLADAVLDFLDNEC